MRRLASELGVTATAIYYHVPDKETLLGLAAEVMISELERAAHGKVWTDRLLALLIEENRLLQRYPGLARYLLEHRDSLAALRWSEVFVSMLLQAGLSPKATTRAFGRITMLINPLFLLDDFAVADSGGSVMTPWAGSQDGQVQAFPGLARVRRHMAKASFDAMFEQNARALVATLDAELRAQQAQSARRRQTPR